MKIIQHEYFRTMEWMHNKDSQIIISKTKKELSKTVNNKKVDPIC